MRKILYVIVIVLSFFAPVERLDIAKLLPIEAVAIYKDSERVILKTDTDNLGTGKDIHEAVSDLKKNTAAVIYLDTAEYLLIGEGAYDDAVQLRQYLRPSVQLGRYTGGDVKLEAKFLDTHRNSAKMTD